VFALIDVFVNCPAEPERTQYDSDVPGRGLRLPPFPASPFVDGGARRAVRLPHQKNAQKSPRVHVSFSSSVFFFSLQRHLTLIGANLVVQPNHENYAYITFRVYLI